MATIAEKLAKKPSKALLQIADEVQEVADRSQSFAYRFEDQEDGSRVEIRCAPTPRLEEIPEGAPGDEGGLAIVDGRPLVVFSRKRVDATAGEVAYNVAACQEALEAAPDEERESIEKAAAAAARAADNLAANLEAGVYTSTHVGIPADDKTVAFIEELGPGGRAFVAH